MRHAKEERLQRKSLKHKFSHNFFSPFYSKQSRILTIHLKNVGAMLLRKRNVNLNQKKGFTFEYLFNLNLNLSGFTAYLTEALGRPHDPADIVVVNPDTPTQILFQIQCKNYKNYQKRIVALNNPKYREMLLAIPRDHLGETIDFLIRQKSAPVMSKYSSDVLERVIKEDNIFNCEIPTSDEVVYATLNPRFYMMKRCFTMMKNEWLVDVVGNMCVKAIFDAYDVYVTKCASVSDKILNFGNKVIKIAITSAASIGMKYIASWAFGENVPLWMDNVGIWKALLVGSYQMTKIWLFSFDDSTLNALVPLINNISSYAGCYGSLKIYKKYWFGVLGSYIISIIVSILLNKLQAKQNNKEERY